MTPRFDAALHPLPNLDVALHPLPNFDAARLPSPNFDAAEPRWLREGAARLSRREDECRVRREAVPLFLGLLTFFCDF